MYDYRKEREKLFTEDGSVQFMRIRDRVRDLLDQAGAVSMGAAISKSTGDTWTMMACVDRMVELGELREVTGGDVWGQHRVFIRRSS